ncbi:MAG: flavin reductase family protein [Thermomicrobiales bacterium]|nr:flavin reductase family protein [Thermomicrobiales bacterium]
MLDPDARKQLLRSFTYGLFWVSAVHREERGVFTANWVSQASFDPPVIMLSVEKTSSTRSLIEASGHFVIGPFRDDQRELAGNLGRPKSRAGDKIVAYDLDVTPMESGGFALSDSLGALGCRVWSESDAGDSIVFIAEVIEARVFSSGTPLTMSAAGFRHFG